MLWLTLATFLKISISSKVSPDALGWLWLFHLFRISTVSKVSQNRLGWLGLLFDQSVNSIIRKVSPSALRWLWLLFHHFKLSILLKVTYNILGWLGLVFDQFVTICFGLTWAALWPVYKFHHSQSWSECLGLTGCSFSSSSISQSASVQVFGLILVSLSSAHKFVNKLVQALLGAFSPIPNLNNQQY